MVRPSNPRLMARVLNAVVNLDDSRGSSAREVLGFIRQSNVSPKNLTVQVHRALKHAVNAGLLRHRSGRYKILATLNPTTSLSMKETNSDQPKAEENKLKSDVPPSTSDAESSHKTKMTTTRRRSNKRRSSNMRRKSRHSPYTRRINATVQGRKRQRKHTYDDEEFEDQSPERYALHERDESPVLLNRRAKRSKITKREPRSDFSHKSNRDSHVNRKRVSRANRSSHRQPKRKEERVKSRARSASKARSPQLQQRMQARQYPIEEIGNNSEQCDGNHETIENTAVYQEPHEDTEETREPNDSNSGSTLENCD